MKIVILGAGGFLGKCILKYLKNYNLIAITRKELNLLNYFEVQTWLVNNEPDIIINCAIAGGTKSGINLQSFDDVKNNVSVFLNFYNNSQYFSKFINIGSGAEFDLDTDIDNFTEDKILNVIPKDSYGYSKNLISRLVLEKPNFYTLRLFGCFDNLEPNYRLFKKLLNSEKIIIKDRKFDYISAEDFCKILEFYIENNDLIKDINCVYQNKLWLNEILNKFNIQFVCDEINLLNYTGNGDKLKTLNINFEGLDAGIKKYIIKAQNGGLLKSE